MIRVEFEGSMIMFYGKEGYLASITVHDSDVSIHAHMFKDVSCDAYSSIIHSHHELGIRDAISESDFNKLVEHIRERGYKIETKVEKMAIISAETTVKRYDLFEYTIKFDIVFTEGIK